MKIKLENLTICQECGCVFSPQYSLRVNGDSITGNTLKITECPACKHKYEIK